MPARCPINELDDVQRADDPRNVRSLWRNGRDGSRCRNWRAGGRAGVATVQEIVTDEAVQVIDVGAGVVTRY